jgi:enamine deaminase RidA (YjgF/YER057c/UK114 family)
MSAARTVKPGRSGVVTGVAPRSAGRRGKGGGQGLDVDVAAMGAPTPENRARAFGLDIPDDVRPAANYGLATLHGGLLYLSGQLPRVDGAVAVTGRVGEDVRLGEAQQAARLCTLRALGALRQVLGSLDRVERVLKLQVFVQCSPEFKRHSEVADAASELLVQVFGAVGLAARTAVGVYQLPKGASVELDLVVACAAPATNLKEQQHAAQH